jgi:hypothetical protein
MSNEKFTANERIRRAQTAEEWEARYGQRYCPGRNKPVLFHGTNMKDYEQKQGLLWIAGWWTTHAGESLSYAFKSAKMFCPEMVVFALPFYQGNPMEKVLPIGAMNRAGENAYHIRGGYTLSKQDKARVEVYFQSDLERFIEKYCIRGAQGCERTYLRAFKKELKEIRARNSAIKAQSS